MGLFTRRERLDADTVREGLVLLRETAEHLQELDLSAEAARLRAEVSEGHIKLEEMRADHDRGKLDIEHKIGLAREKSEQDAANAVKEARLAVKEENLEAATDRLKEQGKFMQDRMESELASQRTLVEQILGRLPDVQYQIHENRGPQMEARPSIGSGDDSAKE